MNDTKDTTETAVGLNLGMTRKSLEMVVRLKELAAELLQMHQEVMNGEDIEGWGVLCATLHNAADNAMEAAGRILLDHTDELIQNFRQHFPLSVTEHTTETPAIIITKLHDDILSYAQVVGNPFNPKVYFTVSQGEESGLILTEVKIAMDDLAGLGLLHPLRGVGYMLTDKGVEYISKKNMETAVPQ